METEKKQFWKGNFIRSLTLSGFTFFSTLTALQFSGIDNFVPVLYSSSLAGGLYFFAELMKYYGIQPSKKVTSESKNNVYSFII